MSSDVGLSRKQRVFAVLETTAGTLKFPAATDFIRPAGNAVCNQSPEFSDSEELVDSLDLLDQFQNATPAGIFSIPMYARPSGSLGAVPQGAALLKSLMGVETINASTSVVYTQATTAPSFSLWIETDHFVQGMSGCTVDQLVIGVNKEGAVMLTSTGKGMQMVWAGTDALAQGEVLSATTITVADASRYRAGVYIYNVTKNDNNAGAGYLVSSLNETTNVITLATGISEAWDSADVIAGYLPAGTVIGSPIESRNTAITIDAVSATIKSTDLTIGSPKKYLDDEVGAEFPTAYIEDRRSIGGSLKLYFRKADAKYFAEGYAGNEVAVVFTFGDTSGSKMQVSVPRSKLKMPEVSFSPPAVEIDMTMVCLGTSGEDSCTITFI